MACVCRAVLKAFHQRWLSCGTQLQLSCSPPQAFSRSWRPKQRKEGSLALGTGVKALRSGHMPGLPSARFRLVYFCMPGCVAQVSASCYHTPKTFLHPCEIMKQAFWLPNLRMIPVIPHFAQACDCILTGQNQSVLSIQLSRACHCLGGCDVCMLVAGLGIQVE